MPLVQECVYGTPAHHPLEYDNQASRRSRNQDGASPAGWTAHAICSFQTCVSLSACPMSPSVESVGAESMWSVEMQSLEHQSHEQMPPNMVQLQDDIEA